MDNTMQVVWTYETCFTSVLFLSFFSCIDVHGCRRRELGGIPSIHQTPEQLCKLENITYIQKVVSSTWVKYQFWVTISLLTVHCVNT